NFTKNWERDHNYFIPAATKPGPYLAIKNRFNTMWNDTTHYAPFQPQNPAAAELVSPAGVNVPVNTKLEWKRAFWAVAYDVYLGTSPSNMTRIGRVNADLTETPPQTSSFL